MKKGCHLAPGGIPVWAEAGPVTASSGDAGGGQPSHIGGEPSFVGNVREARVRPVSEAVGARQRTRPSARGPRYGRGRSRCRRRILWVTPSSGHPNDERGIEARTVHIGRTGSLTRAQGLRRPGHARPRRPWSSGRSGHRDRTLRRTGCPRTRPVLLAVRPTRRNRHQQACPDTCRSPRQHRNPAARATAETDASNDAQTTKMTSTAAGRSFPIPGRAYTCAGLDVQS